MNKNNNFNFLTISALFFSVLGLSVFIYYLFQLSSTFNIFGNNEIDIEKTGQFGDYIGGVVGSLWSFVSVLLFYNALNLQREELANTRDQMSLQLLEMERQRKEFEINRITNIIYKQLEIVGNKQSKLHFIVKTRNIDHRGMAALDIFQESLSIIVEHGKYFSDIEVPQQNEFLKFYFFLLNNDTREYIYSLEKSLIICTQLISNQMSKYLTSEDYNHLMLLLYNNFNLKSANLFYNEIIRVHEIRLNQFQTNPKIENLVETSSYEKQEIIRAKNILKLIKVIKEANK